jgi:stage II sporulation protein P
MKKLTLILRITALICIFSLLNIGIFYVDINSFFGGAAYLSVVSNIPESFFNKNKIEIPTVDFAYSPQVSLPMQNGVLNVSQSVTTSVDEQVIGKILKKTLSPYSANTSFNGVYLNNTTDAAVDIGYELSKKFEYKVKKGEEPQILIYHTHATEGYMRDESDYYTVTDEPRSTDSNENVIAVGKHIKSILEEAGYSVVHDETLHDYPGFTGSYSRSAETVKSAIEKYPSIKVAIDVHRDSITSGKSDKVAPVVTVDGKEAAQVMLVMGSQTGDITDYPNWRQNLRLALKLQYVFEKSYPQFARSILLRSTRYNQNLTTGSILIEMGSDANTKEQAMYSAELVGRSLVSLFDSQN